MPDIGGYLEVGTNERGEVVINHPDLKPDENGVGHIAFSLDQARRLANLLLSHAHAVDGKPRHNPKHRRVRHAGSSANGAEAAQRWIDSKSSAALGITIQQRELIRHAIGLGHRHKITNRNHFVTGPGTEDHAPWMDLVSKGLAHRRDGSEISGGDDVFWVTRETAQACCGKGESLAEDFRE